MGKKKSKSGSKSNNAAKPAAAPKPPAADKPSNPNKPVRAKLPWRERQLLRCERASRLISALGRSCSNAKPPGIEASHLAGFATVQDGEATRAADGTPVAFLTMIATVLAGVPADFKPKRASGSRTGIEIGSTIGVKDDALALDDAKPYFAAFPAALFEGAKVLGDDGMNWIVACTDDVTRVIRKRYVELVDLTADDEDEEDLLSDETPQPSA